jgi:hypothetical protein
MPFSEDQSHQVVALCEAWMDPLPVFPRPSDEIVRDADVDHAERPVGNDVHPAATHAVRYAHSSLNKTSTGVPREMAGSSPAMTMGVRATTAGPWTDTVKGECKSGHRARQPENHP